MNSSYDPQEETSSLLTHLMALRKVLLISLGAIVIAFLAVLELFIDPVMNFLMAPIKAKGIEIIFTAISEVLLTKLKVAFVVAILVASPVIFWQLWSFLKPALYPKERTAIGLLFFISVFLFIGGICFCYYAVYSLAVDFFLVAGENIAVPMLSIDSYIGFIFGFIIPFGLAFLLPVALCITTRLGFTDAEMLASARKYIIFAIFVIAAILTPPDVVSQISLGLPMCLLYELGIIAAKFDKRRNDN